MTSPSRVSGARSGITTMVAVGPSWFGSQLESGFSCDANLLWRTSPVAEGLSSAWKTGVVFSSQRWSAGPNIGFLLGTRLGNTVSAMGDLSAGLLLGRNRYIEAIPSLGGSLLFPRLLSSATLMPFIRMSTELRLSYSQNDSMTVDPAVAMSFGLKWDIR